MTTTTRRKIARSAIRRAKRPQLKNAKSTIHRSRKMHAKYTTAKIKKNMKQMKLYNMRGGIKMPEMPEWLKTGERKRREAAEKEAAEAAAEAKKAEAKKAEAERIEEFNAKIKKRIDEKCGSELSTILSDSVDAVNEILLLEKFFYSLDVNNEDGPHMFKQNGYIEKRQEIKDKWLKTNPNLENVEKSLKKLYDLREQIPELSWECISEIPKMKHSNNYSYIMRYGRPGINIDNIWEILLPYRKIPCNFRSDDFDCR